MKKIWKPLLLTGIAATVLVGCTNEQEIAPGVTEGDAAQTSLAGNQNIDFNALYKMDDKKVLVEVQGKKMTVGEVKEKLFQQGLVGVVNQFIDSSVLLTEYKITDEEVNKEIMKQKENMGDYAKTHAFDKEAIRYNLAYEKALRDGVTYSDKDLKKIYEQYYAENDTRTFEEMKEQLEEQAPYILGGNAVYEKQQKLKQEATIKFSDDTLKAEFDRMLNPPVLDTDVDPALIQEPNTAVEEKETKEKKTKE